MIKEAYMLAAINLKGQEINSLLKTKDPPIHGCRYHTLKEPQEINLGYQVYAQLPYL